MRDWTTGIINPSAANMALVTLPINRQPRR